MAKVIVRHKVENYDSWKPVFDQAFEMRKQSGEVSFKLFRGVVDSNEVIGIFEWDSIERAKEFLESDEIKAKMQEAGVNEKPDIYFLE